MGPGAAVARTTDVPRHGPGCPGRQATELLCSIPTPAGPLLGPSLSSLACSPKTACLEVPLSTWPLNPLGPQALPVLSPPRRCGASPAPRAPTAPRPSCGAPPRLPLLCLRSPGMTPCVSAGVELGLGHLACFREFPCFCVPLESTRLERSSRKLRPGTPQLSAPRPRSDVFSFCISYAEIKKNHG